MKKKIILVLGFLVLLFLGWMGYSSVKTLEQKETLEASQKDLSKMLDKLERADIKIPSSSVLIFFNSECEHCQWEMEQVSKNLDKLKEHQLILSSFEPENEAISFLQNYGLEDFYLKSPPEKVMSAYSGGVPQTFIYKEGKLKRHFKGEVQIEVILNEIEE